MPAGIEFTDSSGVPRFLTSSRPSHGGKLRGFLPDSNRIGPEREVLADGSVYRETFRTDPTASFAIVGLGPEQLETAQLCKLHFDDGGTATLVTDDAAGRGYTIRRAPGTRISITGPDDDYEYTFSMVALNTAGAPMLCVYETQVF